MRSDADAYIEQFRVLDLFDQIVITAKVDADKKGQHLFIEVDGSIEIEADRQFILSAVANILQNGLKYSKRDGKIFLRAKAEGTRVRIEIEDACGGIAIEKIGELFKPYVQKDADRSGLGLGLSIAQQAIALSQGTIRVENKPGSGCVFIIDIPQKYVAGPGHKSAVPGKDSVQPNFAKKT